MSSFESYIALFKKGTARQAGKIVIPGVVAVASESAVRFGPSNRDGNLQLGFRVVRKDEPTTILHENRVSLDVAELRRDQNASFYITLDQSALAEFPLLMIVSFVFEGQFWFYERDGLGCWFELDKDKGTVTCNYSADLNAAAYEHQMGQLFYDRGWINVSDETFLTQFVSNVALVCERFGLQTALYFGYQYILERDPDPLGLAEKIRSVTMGKGTIRDACNELVRSEEFQKKGLAMRSHPARILGSWAFVS